MFFCIRILADALVLVLVILLRGSTGRPKVVWLPGRCLGAAVVIFLVELVLSGLLGQLIVIPVAGLAFLLLLYCRVRIRRAVMGTGVFLIVHIMGILWL